MDLIIKAEEEARFIPEWENKGIDGSCAYWLRPNTPDHKGTYLVGTAGKIYESEKSYGSSPEDSIGIRPAILVEF